MTADNRHKIRGAEQTPERFHRVAMPSACEGLRNALRGAYAPDVTGPLPHDLASLLRQIS